MNTFKDKEGREWDLSLNVGVLARVRQLAGVDLAKALRSEAILAEVLFAEPETFVKVVWVVVEGQAEKRGLTPEQFAFGFDGEVIESASVALLEAVSDFFPRSALAKAVKRRLPAIMGKMDEKMVAAAEEKMDSILNENAGASPASPASIPGR